MVTPTAPDTDRVVRIAPDLLDFALQLTPEDRVRQALCAWQVFHDLHHPYATPRHQGFDSYEEFARATRPGASP
jgi:hypothetical protein